VLVSNAVNRFLDVDRNQLLGLHARDIFDRNTVLGRTVREAWDAGVTLVQEEIVSESGNRIEVSLDFIHDDRSKQGLGALLTLHDQESVEVIESELELSRRMAAIGRLTSGVGTRSRIRSTRSLCTWSCSRPNWVLRRLQPPVTWK
jgi:hypothetical protein